MGSVNQNTSSGSHSHKTFILEEGLCASLPGGQD